MKFFFILLVLIFSLKIIPSYANLGGKGLVCKCIKCSSSDGDIIGYHFEHTNNYQNIRPYRFKNIQDIIKIKQGAGFLYDTTKDEIIWDILYLKGKGKNKLNRKNLILKSYYFKNKNIVQKIVTRKCDVFSNQIFFEVMEKIRTEKQILYDKSLNKNKI